MSDPERVQTSDRLVRAIEEALEALPKDLLSHVWTEGPERLGISVAPEPQWDKQTDAKVVWNWVRERVRWVLEVLGQNPEIAGHWAQSLPKPWLVDLDIGKADLSRVPPKARREYEKVAKARNAICASVPPKGAASVKLPPFPVEVQQAEDEAYAKLDAAGADWDAAFFDNPAVWLWAIWDQWLKTRMKAVPPGKPDWPGAAALANPRGVNRFLFQIRLRIALWITTRPGEAANYFKRALEELREGLPESGLTGSRCVESESDYDTPKTSPELIYLADGAEFYNIPKSTLSKAAMKSPGEPGFLWSGTEGRRRFFRKADLYRIARSREKLGGRVSPGVSSKKNLAANMRNFAEEIGLTRREEEDSLGG